MAKDRELRDYFWWSAKDSADYADSKLAESLRQLRSGELSEKYAPSDDEIAWASRELHDAPSGTRKSGEKR